jgi:hypothetical protein
MFGNIIVREIFGHKMEEMSRGWIPFIKKNFIAYTRNRILFG